MIQKSKYSLLSFCVLIIFNVELVMAEEDFFSMSFDELQEIKITSSSFFDLPGYQSPGFSWIFTQQEINNSPIVALKDIFEFYTPGIAISPTGFSGPSIAVRGISVSDNAKSLVMLNGQNINQRSYYGYQAGLQSTLFGDIDYIEVVNGPGSLIHGSGAINNMINLVPKNGRKFEGLQTNLIYGFKEDLKKWDVSYGQPYGANKNFFLYAGVAEADGFEPESFLEQDKDSEDIIKFVDPNMKVFDMPENYKIAAYINHDELNFQSQYHRIHRSFNKPVGIQDANVFRGYWQTYWVSQLIYNWHLNNDAWIEFLLPFEMFDHGLQLNEREGEKGGRENHVAFKAIFHQEWDVNRFAIGAAIGYRDFDAQKQYFEGNKDLLEESLTGNLIETELFAENIWSINEDWTLSLGLRFDSVNYGDFYEPEKQVKIYPDDLSGVTKRIATSYQINSHQTLKASYQEGFRYPDVAYFLYLGLANYGLNNAGLEPLPELEEETLKSYEINYLHDMLQLPLHWELSFYYNIHEGTLDWQRYTREMLGDERYEAAREAIGWGPGSYTNVDDKYKAYGFDIVDNWQSDNDNLSIRGSYGYSRPTDVKDDVNGLLQLVNESGQEWASYPEHLFKLAINQRLTNKLDLNLTFYYAPQVDVCISDCAQPDKGEQEAIDFHKQDRFRINTRFNYALNDQFSLSLLIQNLFDNDGPPVGYESRQGTGREGGLGDDSRMIYLGLQGKF